ncbi:hypothetical protein AB0F03_33070 [Streptomyces sp. NPDC028722]|uniref:hypothetical protein n=1 Tax=unclassified Streptomyces TaxID=2593676 RepID=UPI0034089C57
MRRHLTIARSMINEPDVLILDEPTTGLDPQARHMLWERLHELKERGVTARGGWCPARRCSASCVPRFRNRADGHRGGFLVGRGRP